ncbi:hypothetical protein EIN_468470 [Entamoeba invadens IP1]|uniref:Uncharacterized protein n=1 Tax=Entamoeba invadens IP1 TaxID=370355 RepID=A0A0A1TWI7_ENTIV|nr:hypothetical protein EIN_468470 [Entamoeba invadens IP1]ELP83703.1 hypothetical protein EIN_468470 [Entamoeba invadens IP1]|eukprot:XP_004183049.1 hypothetical protein EIN_468470 [Entamoeba invadens IP1]
MAVKSKHNTIKNETLGICQWSQNEQQILEDELFRMQQAGQQFNGITSILKISGKFPSKTIQQITSRIKWCQIAPQTRPPWDDYCQNENFYTQRADQQTQSSFISPRNREMYLPSTKPPFERDRDTTRRRRFSLQGENNTVETPRDYFVLSQAQGEYNTQSGLGGQKNNLILIGTNSSSHSPRVYRQHSPVTFNVMQSTGVNTQNYLNKLLEENDTILNNLERQATSPGGNVDTQFILKFIENGNNTILQTKILAQLYMPFFSRKIEVPEELKTQIFPFIQSDLGIQMENIEFTNTSERKIKAMSVDGRGSSQMSSATGSISGF